MGMMVMMIFVAMMLTIRSVAMRNAVSVVQRDRNGAHDVSCEYETSLAAQSLGRRSCHANV